MKLPILLSKSSILVGIDIQPDGASLVCLRKDKCKFLLEKISFLPFAPGLFADGKIAHWDQLTALLFDWMQTLNLKGETVVAALPAAQVRLLLMKADVSIDEKEVRKHVDHHFPGLGATLLVDYAVLPNTTKDIVVAAAKRDYVGQYASCLRDAGFNVKIMDIDLFAIQRAMGGGSQPILWQQRRNFTLIWQNEKFLPQCIQWAACHGEQAVLDLSERLVQYKIANILFCGANYYVELFRNAKQLPATIAFYTLPFDCSERNLSDYLLALGLAMRDAPSW